MYAYYEHTNDRLILINIEHFFYLNVDNIEERFNLELKYLIITIRRQDISEYIITSRWYYFFLLFRKNQNS